MSELLLVRRANVLLDISKDQKDEYLAKGFDVVDEQGNVITPATMTNDVSVLKKKLTEAQDKIKQLEQENERLNKELDEMAGMEDQEEEDEAPQGLVDPEPKKGSSKKSNK